MDIPRLLFRRPHRAPSPASPQGQGRVRSSPSAISNDVPALLHTERIRRSLPCDDRAPVLALPSLALVRSAFDDLYYGRLNILVVEVLRAAIASSLSPPDMSLEMTLEVADNRSRVEVVCESGSIVADLPKATILLLDDLATRWRLEAGSGTIWFELDGRAQRSRQSPVPSSSSEAPITVA